MKIKKDCKLLTKFGFIITLALFASCSNISGSDSSIEQSYEKYSNKTTAEIYIETLFTRDELFTSRNIADYDYPDFFYELDMVDKDGTSIKFEDLTKKEKDVFVQLWKEKITENIEEKTKIQSDAVDIMRGENIAFLNALYSTNSNRAIINKNPSQVMKKYEKNLNKLHKIDSSREVKNSKIVTNDNNNIESLKIFMDNYKRGRILVSLSSESSSSINIGLGHASLMDNESVFIEENNQYKKTCPLESWTISSYPQTISSEWEGKANGVQFEPLGLWVGKDQGCCSDVRIYDMQKIVWVWDWFNSGYKPFPADEHDYDLAADYAENSIGIGYGILTKESRNLIYCSALVWQSWRYLNRSYDMSAGFQVTPAEIANSMQTKLITVYYNK